MMTPGASLLLDDFITQRLVLVWPLVPDYVRTGDSRTDLCHEWASLCGCEPEDAASRAPSLIGLGVINLDGTIDPNAKLYLDRLAAVRAKSIGLTLMPSPESDD